MIISCCKKFHQLGGITLKKSIILGVTAAAALLAANPTTGSANAGDKQITLADVKAHTFEVKNMNELQSVIDRFEKQYNISIQGLDQLQQTQQVDESQEKQAPAKEQAEQKEQATPAKQAQPEAQEASKEQSEQQSSLSEFEQQVVNLTNQEREKAGLAPLEVDSELSKVAQAKSEDMRDNNYFAHNSPTYGSPFDMMNQFGVEYQTAGENIAKGQQTPEEVVNAWMNSEGHRKNIMNGSFTHIGVGYVEEGNIWTQQFIGK